MYLFTNPLALFLGSVTVSSEDVELLYIVQVLCLVSAGETINVSIVMTVVFVRIFYLTFVLDIYLLSFMFVITIVVTVVLAFLLTVVMMIATSKYW